MIPLLSISIWLPIIVGFGLLATSGAAIWHGRLKYSVLTISLLSLATVTYALFNFDPNNLQMQYIEHLAWLPNLGISYALGVDGFAILLLALTAFMTLMVIIAALSHVKNTDYVKYCSVFLIMQGLMSGVFVATDAVLFYVFFEAMMIPMFMIIGLWGGHNRIYATMKFFLYTFFGSLFLLAALLYLNHAATTAGVPIADSFAISTFQKLALSDSAQKFLFWGFLLAFAVKVPMWPVHTWLPDAHVEAPTGGSVILAAITLKIGGYGMLRFLLPIVPQGCEYFASVVIALSLIAIVYISLITIIQQDLKKLIAYSSIAHMAFVTLGLFVVFKTANTATTNAMLGIDGAMLQMISHGFISGALFLCVGVLYARMHTRQIADYGGVTASMPVFSSFFMLFALANVGMPGTIGFVGEFLVILASFKANVWYALIASTSLVLVVAYTLWMYKRVMFGSIINNSVAALRDLSVPEKTVFVLLATVILLFGIWPNPILQTMRGSSQHLLNQVVINKGV